MASTSARRASRAPTYRCSECGWQAAKWVGRCGECQAWGTVAEAGGPTPVRTAPVTVVERPAVPIAEVPDLRLAPGVDELLAEQGIIDTVV